MAKEALKEAQERLEEAENDFNEAIDDLSEAEDDFNEAIDDLSEANDDLIEAIDDLKKAKSEEDLEEAIEDLEEAQEDIEQAQEDIEEALEDGAEAQEDLDQAQGDINQAQEGINQAQKDCICYLTGTHILTDKGEVLVEDLNIGDIVQTTGGSFESIKWIGRQTIEPRIVRNPLRGYPILLKAGAMGNSLPHRDLYVSPDHALLFEGLLINAGALVNDISIIKTRPNKTFTYYHIELDKHALLVAEGTAAESYLPQSEDRLVYDNGAEYEELYPHGNRIILWPLDYPRISSYTSVPRYIRNKLQSIAAELGLVAKAS